MSNDAAARKQARSKWSSEVFRGNDVHGLVERDALDEWASMVPEDRMALAWSLSVAQVGASNDEPVLARLPRSAYRLERR
jgi:hypothetical protein